MTMMLITKQQTRWPAARGTMAGDVREVDSTWPERSGRGQAKRMSSRTRQLAQPRLRRASRGVPGHVGVLASRPGERMVERELFSTTVQGCRRGTKRRELARRWHRRPPGAPWSCLVGPLPSRRDRLPP